MITKLKPTSTTALVVVDVQNGFVNDNSEHVVPVVVRLVERWVANERPVYLTRFLNLRGSKWETLIGWTRVREQPETDLVAEIQPFIDRCVVVDKSNLYSSLTGALRDDLDSGAINDVVVCGIATESCVLATALGVFEHPRPDARPWVVTDACYSHAGASAHAAGLAVIERYIGRSQLIPGSALIAD